jgi:hypothetical protein
MSRAPQFTPEAARRWSDFNAPEQQRFLDNVWCASCRSGTSILDFSGRMDGDDLILDGRCGRCGSRVARLIEGE